MTSVLCSMPGRHGDILWSLASVRAIAEAYDQPVTMAIAGKYGSLKPLLEAQPYIKQCLALPNWVVQETAPITPRTPEGAEGFFQHFDHQYHLGYEGWPEAPLPFDCERIANVMRSAYGLPPIQIDLERPWIQAEPWQQMPHEVILGWSDEWFELKWGITSLLTVSLSVARSGFILCAPNSRWETELPLEPTDWIENARRIAACDLFLGCCSALHVLAVAMGKPVVIMEPSKDRWNPVFYPLGMDGPRVTVVRGGDGLPTFDARHVKDAVEAALRG